MQSVADSKFSAYKYSTIRFISDWNRQIAVPVGVAIWSQEEQSFFLRLASKGERVNDLSLDEASPHVRAFEQQIGKWVASSNLPYSRHDFRPLSDEWWIHVAGLLRFRVRLDEPQPIDCVAPDVEVDALFEAAVRPSVSRQQRAQRLETLIKNAIGPQNNSRLQSKTQVFGYENKPIGVLKAYHNHGQVFIVEAVNLAGKDAERDADALASKLSRINEGPYQGNVRAATAYFASPNGLNGEAHLVDWIGKMSGARVFDVVREASALKEYTETNLAELDPHPTLL